MKTRARPGRNVGNMDDPQRNVTRRAPSARHPVRAAERETAHLRRVVDEGESAATPFLIVAAVVVTVVPLLALVMLLDFGSAHFA